MNCMYCKQFVSNSSEDERRPSPGTECLWWVCVRCNVYVEYVGKLAIHKDLAVIKFERKFNGKDYYIWIDYKSKTTTVGSWEETDDGITIGGPLPSMTIPTIMHDINPANAQNKLSTILVFS